MKASELIAQASERVGGLTDLGEPDCRPALHALLDALNAQPGLSASGEALWRARLIGLLQNRLLMEAYFVRHPEIEQEVIESPIVIVGLPRTGTTLLQRMFSADTRLTPILWWETRYPSPLDLEADLTRADRRVELAQQEVAAMIDANPDLLSMHPLDAMAADEEGQLLEHSFQSFFDAYADIPSYTRWMWQADQAPAYRHLKKMLKFVQWQKRQRGETIGPWVLKTPHHLRQIDVLFKVFADCRVVQTHRDPLQTIPSICSFHEGLWQLHMSHPDPLRIGRQWSAIWARAMTATMAFRDNGADGRFLDIAFTDTLKRPIEVVRRVYDFAGLEMPAATQSSIELFLDSHKREYRPAHNYSMQRFGLSELQLAQDFREYRQRYILAHSDAS